MVAGTNSFAKQILHEFVLVTMRVLNSYDEFYIVSREETQKQIQTATELINEVDKFLDEKQEK